MTPVLEIPRCAYCDAELDARKPHHAGRPRRYCSDRCRKAAYRNRLRSQDEPALEFVTDMPPLPAAPPADELVAQTVLEARSTVVTLAQLAPVARRPFAWRCERAAIEMKATLDAYFPEH